jgi:cobalt/nickel transport system ATP-binding protein
MSMTDILQTADLSVAYPDGQQALSGVSLTVPAGRRVAVIGPNGAGKTSLQLAIMGALKHTGKILVDGIELSRRTLRQVRGCCGMIFENAEDQLFMPTLLEDVAFGPLNQGLPPAEAEARSRAAIAAVGLAGLADRSAHHLSAGQKRAAAIATVLSMDVRLLLLDEPASGLDFRSRRRLIEVLSPRPEAMLLATHDLDLARRLCQDAILLDDGQLVSHGPVEQLLDDAPLLRAHGLA